MLRTSIAVALLLAPAAALAQAAPAKPPACADADHHAFDFWVGRWDVKPMAGGPVVAHSLIEDLYAGCAIRENWMPLRGAAGGSLSSFNARDGHWHQTWVSANGVRVEFTGGIEDGAMVLTGFWPGSGPKGEDGLTRMRYSQEPGGAVRQHGEFSADAGKSWVTTFDLLYTPAAPE